MKTKTSFSTAGKMIEGPHEVLVVWPEWNQKAKGRVVNNGYTTVVYMEAPYPALLSQWTPIEQPPEGEKLQRLVLVRRSSDEILMGRYTGKEWIVYFINTKGVQVATGEQQAYEFKIDPVVDWQELPKTPQQIQFMEDTQKILNHDLERTKPGTEG